MIDWLALALLLALALFSSAAMVQAPICMPPEEPWVPDSEADFREYADLVAADFERYFSALARHFQGLEAAWQDGIARGRSVDESSCRTPKYLACVVSSASIIWSR